MQQKEDSVTNGFSTITLDDLIRAALTGQRYNNERLGRAARRYARKISNRYGADLAEDLHEEVFDEAFVELFQAGPEALADKTGLELFRLAVIAAIRTVRANNAPPGQRTRLTKKPQRRRVAPEDVMRIPTARDLERATVNEGEHQLLDFDALEDPKALEEFRQLDRSRDLQVIMQAAPQLVSGALHLIHVEEQPVNAVAKLYGLSRFALHRRIEAFCAPWRLAA